MNFFNGFEDEICKLASKTPFVGSIESMTVKNKNFRKVLFTGDHSQLVLMTVQPGEDLGEEIHNGTDQFFRIEEGEAIFVLNGKKHTQKAGGAVVIPSGTKHNIINASKTAPLKVYTIYSPHKHPPGTVHRSKLDALNAEMSKQANGEEEEETASGPMPKNINDILKAFFKGNAKPVDDQIHELAESLKVSPHDLETKIYAMLGSKMNKKASEKKEKKKGFLRKAGPGLGALAGLGLAAAAKKPLLSGIGAGATVGWIPDISASLIEAIKGE